MPAPLVVLTAVTGLGFWEVDTPTHFLFEVARHRTGNHSVGKA